MERGFSISGNVLTDDRTLMTERTPNARLNTLDGIRSFKNNISQVPIPIELIAKAQQARKSYETYLQKEKDEKREIEEKEERKKERKKEFLFEEEKKKEIEKKRIINKRLELTNEIEKKENELEEQREITNAMLDGAQIKLKNCVQSKDLVGTVVAQKYLELAVDNRSNEKAEQKLIDELKKQLKNLK